MPAVTVIGTGISGLTCALELLSHGFDVTLLERGTRSGGKMIGYYNSDRKQFTEHSMRTFYNVYIHLQDILNRCNCLRALRKADHFILIPDRTQLEQHVKLTVDSEKGSGFRTYLDLIRKFRLTMSDLLLIGCAVCTFATDESSRVRSKQMDISEYMQMDRLSKHGKAFMTSMLGILVAARPNAAAYDVMKRILVLSPSTFYSVIKHQRLHGAQNFCINGPTSDVIIDPIVQTIFDLGGRFSYQQEVLSISEDRIHIRDLLDGTTRYDPRPNYVVVATSVDVAFHLGALPRSIKHVPNDEWSFGTQFMLKSLPDELVPFQNTKGYVALFDSPWQIVLQLHQKHTNWTEAHFPDGYTVDLSVTCSNLTVPGALYHKPMSQLTPDEVKHEILFQVGITHQQVRTEMMERSTIDYDNMRYVVDAGTGSPDRQRLGLERDGNWENLSQVFVKTGAFPNLGVQCEHDQTMLWCGEYVSAKGYFQIPTMESCCSTGKMAADSILRRHNMTVDVLIDPEISMGFVIRFICKIYSRLFLMWS